MQQDQLLHAHLLLSSAQLLLLSMQVTRLILPAIWPGAAQFIEIHFHHADLALHNLNLLLQREKLMSGNRCVGCSM